MSAIDWPVRFRAAASTAARMSGTVGMAVALHEAARCADELPPHTVEAIVRALLSEEATLDEPRTSGGTDVPS